MDEQNKILKPFGPTILKSRIDDVVFDAIKLAVENSKSNHVVEPNYLAGEFINGQNKDLLLGDNAPLILNWVQQKAKEYGQSINDRNIEHCASQLKLPIIWVNYQKKSDFNPVHNHSGLLSFIMYVKMPTLINEQKYSGDINWRYGESQDLIKNTLNITPQEQDFFMFPSWLDHWVYPFANSNDTRITVAGNLFLS